MPIRKKRIHLIQQYQSISKAHVGCKCLEVKMAYIETMNAVGSNLLIQKMSAVNRANENASQTFAQTLEGEQKNEVKHQHQLVTMDWQFSPAENLFTQFAANQESLIEANTEQAPQAAKETLTESLVTYFQALGGYSSNTLK